MRGFSLNVGELELTKNAFITVGGVLLFMYIATTSFETKIIWRLQLIEYSGRQKKSQEVCDSHLSLQWPNWKRRKLKMSFHTRLYNRT